MGNNSANELRRTIISKDTGITIALLIVIVGVACAATSAYVQVQYNTRVIAALDERYVPRRELEAQLQTITERQVIMQEDINEIKEAVQK